MKIGILGLGRVGLPIAEHFHSTGHIVFSWTRSKREVPWQNSTNIKTLTSLKLDALVIASGRATPANAQLDLELASTLRLLPAKFQLSISRILYVSSGAVYGECARPMSELDNPTPVTQYGEVKLATESALKAIDPDIITSVRVSNIVDSENPYGLLDSIKRGILSGESITLIGNKDDCRDYIDVEDFTRIMEALLQQSELSRVINIGSGQPLNLSAIEVILRESTRSVNAINWHSPLDYNLHKTQLNVDLMKSLISVEPKDSRTTISNFVRRIAASKQCT
jgi:nucleoside-diphosphate-sugar epimerase